MPATADGRQRRPLRSPTRPVAGGVPRWVWRVLAVVVVALLAVLVVLAAARLRSAARAANQGKTALLRAETDMAGHRLDAARADLQAARPAFLRMRRQIHGLGPLLPVARVIPFLRIQVRGVEAFADAGLLLTKAGLPLVDAARAVLEPSDQHLALSTAVDRLRQVDTSLTSGVDALRDAARRVATLNGYRLVGPLATARADLARRLPRIQTKAESAQSGVRALVAFSGGNGPRRYLVFTQNPDEVRPTGGFIGTYGVLAGRGGELSLERYDAIESWYKPRPQAAIPPDQAPTAFQFAGVPQTIANVNVTPDWPQAARLAMDLWRRGGEEPVDGVVSVTPPFMARILAVLGPVDVPTYGERITAANLQDRVDFYTHLEGKFEQGPGGRKKFLAALGEVVVAKLLSAPASSWDRLGQSAAEGFRHREAMAFSTDGSVAEALSGLGWDGAVPAFTGDFFAEGEFEFSAKNGRGLRRTFDHQVDLHPDGSATITTTVTIANTEPLATEGLVNIDSSSYVTIYGPQGAQLASGSDPPESAEPAIAGHPGAGWVRSAQAMGQTTLRVVMDAPAIAVKAGGGRQYRLRWLPLPAHTGDVAHLTVKLPKGWRWKGPAPPATVDLSRDFSGQWTIATG